MSTAFERIAEGHIARAAAAGEFDRLPDAGRPLDLGDELLVPLDVRMANRILKNAACLPPELEALKEARDAADRAAVAMERIASSRGLLPTSVTRAAAWSVITRRLSMS